MPAHSDTPRDTACSPVVSRFSNIPDVTALLAAFCFFLSAVEYMLPKPLPFMRLGIANLPILLAVDLLPFQWFFVLAAAKVVGMSIISGTLFSYVALFSLAGTLVAALVMRGVRMVGKQAVSPIGISIAGAVTSNAIQMLIARYVIFGEVAWLIAPLFLATGLVTGTAMGLFAAHFAATSRWYACAVRGTEYAPEAIASVEDSADTAPAGKPGRTSRALRRDSRRGSRREAYESRVNPVYSALAGIALAIAFLFQRGLLPKTIFLIGFILWAWVAGKRFSFGSTLVVSLGIIVANLLIPSGRVIMKIGPLTVTELALIEGISKALTFEGLMYLSKAAIMPGLRFPGRFGAIIAQAFRYYDRIIEYRGGVRARSFVRDIDSLL
ncbi:MAG: Gx transporter family protein, partial [Rectinema sp.]|nr:Gx transporter family protein [Rectinema sp.]